MSENKVTVLGKNAEERLEILRDEKGNILLTDDQKRAVLERGRILVSASAGSGKTSTMVKRIIVMISEGATLKNLLVLVYNNAAADELKEKLHQELFKAACASSGEKRNRFRQEIDELPFCHICTIHAFCQSLIRENFDKLGISPTFDVLDETRHASYMNRALDDVIATYTASGDETFCELADIFSQSRKEENLKSNLIKFYGLIEIQPDKEEFEKCVSECYDSYENSKFFAILQDYYKTFFANAKNALLPIKTQLEVLAPTSKYLQSLAVAICFCDEIESKSRLFDMCTLASKYEKPRATVSPKASDEEKLLVGYVKDYLKQFHDAIDEMKEICNRQDSLESAHEQNAKYVKKLVEVAQTFAKNSKSSNKRTTYCLLRICNTRRSNCYRTTNTSFRGISTRCLWTSIRTSTPRKRRSYVSLSKASALWSGTSNRVYTVSDLPILRFSYPDKTPTKRA